MDVYASRLSLSHTQIYIHAYNIYAPQEGAGDQGDAEAAERVDPGPVRAREVGAVCGTVRFCACFWWW